MPYPYTDIAKHFDVDTAEHEMTILHDDGLYRHIRFTKPGGSSYWYDLITVPRALIFRGDYESHVFSIAEDMFAFFRSNPDRGMRPISPDYWAQKLTSDRDCVKTYSPELFEQIVKEATVEAIRYGNAPRGIGKAVRERILNDEDVHYEDGARQVLDRFEHGAKNEAKCMCGATVEFDADGLPPLDWTTKHRGGGHDWSSRRKTAGFRFSDTWEWSFADFDHGYLWACHAIVAGIAQYDAAKGAAARPVETVAVTSGAVSE